MSLDEMIAVLQAAKAGKVIQARHRSGVEFILATNPCWDFSIYDYRVKPEPREGFIQPGWLKQDRPYPESIRVREVL